MAVQQVTVPDIGGAEGAEVIELLVAVGDQVALDEGLIVLESDKASMEIPSTAAGTVVELLAAVGDHLAGGAPVARIEVAGQVEDKGEAAANAAPAAQAEPPTAQAANAVVVPPEVPPVAPPLVVTATPAAAVVAETAPVAATFARARGDTAEPIAVYAGPAVRKLAREFGVLLGQVPGSGPQGRILKEDLQQFVQGIIGVG